MNEDVSPPGRIVSGSCYVNDHDSCHLPHLCECECGHAERRRPPE